MHKKAYKNQCSSTISAPFKGETTEHQCADMDDHQHNHHCGCGHEWTTDQRLVKNGDEG